jgi:hypothetical protein
MSDVIPFMKNFLEKEKVEQKTVTMIMEKVKSFKNI